LFNRFHFFHSWKKNFRLCMFFSEQLNESIKLSLYNFFNWIDLNWAQEEEKKISWRLTHNNKREKKIKLIFWSTIWLREIAESERVRERANVFIQVSIIQSRLLRFLNWKEFLNIEWNNSSSRMCVCVYVIMFVG